MFEDEPRDLPNVTPEPEQRLDGGASPEKRRRAYRLPLPSWIALANPDNYLANPWDCAVIRKDGEEQRFHARPPRAQTSHKLDIQQTKGRDGARLVHTGVQPSRVQLRIYVWRGDDEARFRKFLPKINPKLTPDGRVLAEVSHPSLDAHVIQQVYIYDIAEELGADVPQCLTVYLDVLESRFVGAGKKGDKKIKAVKFDIVMPNQFEFRERSVPDVRSTTPSPADEVGVP